MSDLIGWILVAELGTLVFAVFFIWYQLERGFMAVAHNQGVALERIDALERFIGRSIANSTKDLIDQRNR